MNRHANSDMNISGESACPGRNHHKQTSRFITRTSRPDIAFIFDSLLLILRQRDLRALRFAGLLVAVVVLEAVFLTICIPNASITPGPGSSGVSPDGQISVHASRFSTISQAAVYVNGEQRMLERGFDGNDFATSVDARPGSSILVDVRVESALGVERDMASSFTTGEPETLP